MSVLLWLLLVMWAPKVPGKGVEPVNGTPMLLSLNWSSASTIYVSSSGHMFDCARYLFGYWNREPETYPLIRSVWTKRYGRDVWEDLKDWEM